jgi:hypothetical protein
VELLGVPREGPVEWWLVSEPNCVPREGSRTWVCLSPAVSRGGQKAGWVVVSEPRCFKMAATKRRLWTSSGSRNQSSSTKKALSPRKTHNFLAPPNNISIQPLWSTDKYN